MNCRLPIAAALFAALCIANVSSAGEIPVPKNQDYPAGTLKIAVDATDLKHRIFSVHETIPARPGALTLLYPQWIPGTHAPIGPIDALAGLVMTANGKRLDWVRDTLNVYAFHVTVPPGAHSIDAAFQFLSPLDKSQGRIVMTPEMLDLQWNTVSLYPAGYYADRIRAQASVTYPPGWQSATALNVASIAGNTVVYAPIDYDDLVDSPVYAGTYFKRIDLDPGASAAVHLNIFADDPQYLNVPADQIEAYKNLVQQMYRLYGARHYDHYDFLLALSDKLSRIGREHHRSSELGASADYFEHKSAHIPQYELLPHELNHSWNGKYRRGADQDTANLNEPLQDGSLWVYEGQTRLMGYVMTARAGLWTPEQARDMIASVAATFDTGRPGLASWRTVRDTTNDPAMRASATYISYQATYDYYGAGMMIWLDVDGQLRALSHDTRSLDDFCKIFFGMQNGSFAVNPYSFEDVVNTLNAIAPFDWASYLRARLDGHGPLTGGIQSHGWKLVYTDEPSADMNESNHATDLTYSIGAVIGSDGDVEDVVWNKPAFVAGLAPGMKVIAINGKTFSGDALKAAVIAAKRDKTMAIELLAENLGENLALHINYHDGLRYPHLVRGEGRDTLSELLAPRP
ncbi:M61 family peptidase [Dyella monticola]|uniref:M61 family peptidase n=1 Tax=Dyella monticola TaxID=1927958 RepID=A0A370X3B8_9GAMM|nr:M61 family metallopeptidase [Dyella monticola]RDS82836.1 M61 family peptidase [Dyella monticola]